MDLIISFYNVPFFSENCVMLISNTLSNTLSKAIYINAYKYISYKIYIKIEN